MVPKNTLEESQKQRRVSCCPAAEAERGAAGCSPARGSWPRRDSVPRESRSPAEVWGCRRGSRLPGLPVRHLLGPWAAGKAVLGVAEDDQLVTLAGQSTPVICPWSCDEQDGFWSDKARRRLTEVWAGKDIVMTFLEEVAPCGYLRVRFQYCRSLESRCLWRLMSVEAE